MHLAILPVGVDHGVFGQRRGEHEFGQWIFELALDGAFERTRAVGNVTAR